MNGNFTVGVGKVELHLPYCQSSKEQLKQLAKLTQQLKKNGFSVSYFAGQDPKRGVLGFAKVGNSASQIEGVLEQAFQLIALENEIVSQDRDILSYGEA